MKKALSLSLVLILSINLISQSAGLSFDHKEINLGNIVRGESTVKSFNFTNKGSQNIHISKCTAACGCAIVNCPKSDIKPNAKSSITVKYNAVRSGSFDKTITIYTDDKANEVYLLKISGKVIDP